MKSKFFTIPLAFFVILIFIIVLINIWINSETAKIKPDKKETAPQQAMIETPGIFVEQEARQSPPASLHRPAITVIKAPTKEKAVAVFEDKIKGIQEPTKSPSSAAQNPPVPQSASDNFSDEPTSGITKINKRPSEAESKEMNEKGIMIW